MRAGYIYEKVVPQAAALAPMLNAYKAEIGEDALSEAQLLRLDAAIKSGDIMFFTARRKDEVFAMCSVSRTFSTYTCDYSGVFEDFYVKPQFRHHGAARGLVSFVFDCCRALDIHTLWVGSSAGDAGMYKSLGFDAELGNLLSHTI